MATIEQLKEKSAQAYQVIGYLDEVVSGNTDIQKPEREE